ncbi:MAG: cytochrome o ubiquinol oxidase subunit III [Verrucomicrobia bacterium]|nr:cytochrome o ubiquinol oxidase subunit III [Verrucomicrobiota bacterium]
MTIYHRREAHPDLSVPDPHQDVFSRVTLGFWCYLMTDCLIFCTLFATYAVLHNNTYGGPSTNDIYHLPLVFAETMALLFSSISNGLGLLAALKSDKKKAVFWLIFAFIFGASFVAMELHEFNGLALEGHDWTKSAFLSSFFTLVGTHGLHVSIGLFWMANMIAQIHFMGITIDTFRRLVAFSLFWHFLDLVWIFIFTFVYLMGVI